MADACRRLLKRLRVEAGWPLPDADLDDLTFSYRKQEIHFLRNEAFQIERILQVRPMPGLKRAVFIIDQGENDLNRFAIRRIAIHFSTRPNRLAPRPYFELEDMVFLVISSNDLVSVAHFQGANGLDADMAVFGPEPVSDCLGFLEQVEWEHFLPSDWCVGSELYIRHRRIRGRNRCSREFLKENCPELVDLFDVACSANSLEQVEEDRLFWHARRGAAWATERILRKNLGLVFDVAYRICKRYEACQVPFEYVFGGGIDGLMIAIEKYEFEQGHRFSGYAWPWVSSKADKIFAKSLWPIKVSGQVWDKVRNSCVEFASMKSVSESPAAEESLGDTLGPDARLAELSRLLTWESVELVDANSFFEDTADPGAECAYTTVIETISIPFLLDGLSAREKDILLLRNGLHSGAWGREFTLQEVANAYDLTQERVRQIELKAIKWLRKQEENVSA